MFNTDLPLYGIFIALSLLANVILLIKLLNKENYTAYEIVSLLLLENVGIIYGAKILSYLANPKAYTNFDIEKLGLSSYGGLIGALLMVLLFSIIYSKSYKRLLYLHTPSIPLMYAIGKIGCFISGCCYGIKYNGIFNIKYYYSTSAPKGVSLFPVQIVETIFFLLIFVYIYKKIIKEKDSIVLIANSFILCGLVKFSLDFLRYSHINNILSLNQVLSLLFIVTGIILLMKNRHNNRK